jgi:hypothetical protein
VDKQLADGFGISGYQGCQLFLSNICPIRIDELKDLRFHLELLHHCIRLGLGT